VDVAQKSINLVHMPGTSEYLQAFKQALQIPSKDTVAQILQLAQITTDLCQYSNHQNIRFNIIL